MQTNPGVFPQLDLDRRRRLKKFFKDKYPIKLNQGLKINDIDIKALVHFCSFF
jgi:hypothetical protein